MIDYVDPTPAVIEFLSDFFNESEVEVVGGKIPADMQGTVIGVRPAGGSPYAARPFSRVRLLARADVDFDASDALIAACNELERYGYQLKGVRVLQIRVDGRPIPDTDEDTGQPEAWTYILIEHLEA